MDWNSLTIEKTVAIRIATNYVKDDKVAICGDHGWHDWYLSVNLKKNT